MSGGSFEGDFDGDLMGDAEIAADIPSVKKSATVVDMRVWS